MKDKVIAVARGGDDPRRSCNDRWTGDGTPENIIDALVKSGKKDSRHC